MEHCVNRRRNLHETLLQAYNQFDFICCLYLYSFNCSFRCVRRNYRNSSPTLDVDPIKDCLSGAWNTNYYFSSPDPENSIAFGNYENIVAVDDQLYPIDTMPFLYFTSSVYFTYQVKRAVYNYQTRKYEFTNISGNIFKDNSRATESQA